MSEFSTQPWFFEWETQKRGADRTTKHCVQCVNLTLRHLKRRASDRHCDSGVLASLLAHPSPMPNATSSSTNQCGQRNNNQSFSNIAYSPFKIKPSIVCDYWIMKWFIWIDFFRGSTNKSWKWECADGPDQFEMRLLIHIIFNLPSRRHLSH